MLNSKVPEMGDWLQECEPPWFRFSGNPPPRKVRDEIRSFGVGCFKMGSVLSSLVSWGTQRQLKPWGLWLLQMVGSQSRRAFHCIWSLSFLLIAVTALSRFFTVWRLITTVLSTPNPHSQLCHRCPQLLSLSRMARDFVKCPRWFSVKLRKCGGGW